MAKKDQELIDVLKRIADSLEFFNSRPPMPLNPVYPVPAPLPTYPPADPWPWPTTQQPYWRD